MCDKLESEVGEWIETVFTEWYRELADVAAQGSSLVWSWKAGKSRSSNTMVLTDE